MRSDREIIDQTNELAIDLAGLDGYDVGKDYKMWNSKTPSEDKLWKFWEMACKAQEVITQTDVYDIEIEETFSVSVSDFSRSNAHSWVCPACKETNETSEEPQFDVIDIFECSNCHQAIKLEK